MLAGLEDNKHIATVLKVSDLAQQNGAISLSDITPLSLIQQAQSRVHKEQMQAKKRKQMRMERPGDKKLLNDPGHAAERFIAALRDVLNEAEEKREKQVNLVERSKVSFMEVQSMMQFSPDQDIDNHRMNGGWEFNPTSPSPTNDIHITTGKEWNLDDAMDDDYSGPIDDEYEEDLDEHDVLTGGRGLYGMHNDKMRMDESYKDIMRRGAHIRNYKESDKGQQDLSPYYDYKTGSQRIMPDRFKDYRSDALYYTLSHIPDTYEWNCMKERAEGLGYDPDKMTVIVKNGNNMYKMHHQGQEPIPIIKANGQPLTAREFGRDLNDLHMFADGDPKTSTMFERTQIPNKALIAADKEVDLTKPGAVSKLNLSKRAEIAGKNLLRNRHFTSGARKVGCKDFAITLKNEDVEYVNDFGRTIEAESVLKVAFKFEGKDVHLNCYTLMNDKLLFRFGPKGQLEKMQKKAPHVLEKMMRKVAPEQKHFDLNTGQVPVPRETHSRYPIEVLENPLDPTGIPNHPMFARVNGIAFEALMAGQGFYKDKLPDKNQLDKQHQQKGLNWRPIKKIKKRMQRKKDENIALHAESLGGMHQEVDLTKPGRPSKLPPAVREKHVKTNLQDKDFLKIAKKADCKNFKITTENKNIEFVNDLGETIKAKSVLKVDFKFDGKNVHVSCYTLMNGKLLFRFGPKDQLEKIKEKAPHILMKAMMEAAPEQKHFDLVIGDGKDKFSRTVEQMTRPLGEPKNEITQDLPTVSFGKEKRADKKEINKQYKEYVLKKKREQKETFKNKTTPHKKTGKSKKFSKSHKSKSKSNQNIIKQKKSSQIHSKTDIEDNEMQEQYDKNHSTKGSKYNSRQINMPKYEKSRINNYEMTESATSSDEMDKMNCHKKTAGKFHSNDYLNMKKSHKKKMESDDGLYHSSHKQHKHIKSFDDYSDDDIQSYDSEQSKSFSSKHAKSQWDKQPSKSSYGFQQHGFIVNTSKSHGHNSFNNRFKSSYDDMDDDEMMNKHVTPKKSYSNGGNSGGDW
ncbi:MAG: hypothetical protein GY821_03860 [Gammaproteobacteria bacterium]|nr:hypothetical protein [Gammaproteobacteria bacterium]